MVKNKKGQALVEFIIILPIFIFMILTVIDIGKLLYDKNIMQNNLNDVVSLYKQGNNYEKLEEYLKEKDDKAKLEISNEDNKYIEFKIIKTPVINTPGLNLLIKDLEAKRVVNYE